jgi:hypothetical protein
MVVDYNQIFEHERIVETARARIVMGLSWETKEICR